MLVISSRYLQLYTVNLIRSRTRILQKWLSQPYEDSYIGVEIPPQGTKSAIVRAKVVYRTLHRAVQCTVYTFSQ